MPSSESEETDSKIDTSSTEAISDIPKSEEKSKENQAAVVSPTSTQEMPKKVSGLSIKSIRQKKRNSSQKTWRKGYCK
nr:hypothetical protein [Gillisia marina]